MFYNEPNFRWGFVAEATSLLASQLHSYHNRNISMRDMFSRRPICKLHMPLQPGRVVVIYSALHPLLWVADVPCKSLLSDALFI